MTFDTFLGISGLLLGVVSFVYAIYQQRTAANLQTYRTKALRAELKECIVAMSQSYYLVSRNEDYEIRNPEALKKISVIHAATGSLLKQIFHELSEIDTPYNEAKLKQYVDSGLITSQWVWQLAYSFVQSGEEIKMPDLPENTRDWLQGENHHLSSTAPPHK